MWGRVLSISFLNLANVSQVTRTEKNKFVFKSLIVETLFRRLEEGWKYYITILYVNIVIKQ